MIQDVPIEKWFSPSGDQVSWEDITALIQGLSPDQLWVGTDSHMVGQTFVFATALVMCRNADSSTDRVRLYYITRFKVPATHYGRGKDALRRRLMDEVQASVSLSLRITAQTGHKPIIHADLNPSEQYKSGKYAKQLQNYVKGCGFEMEIKPNAWASSGVADKHSK